MDLDLAEHQEMIVKAFRDLLTTESSSERIRAVDPAQGHDPGLWEKFAAMGGHNLSVAANGGSLADAALVGFEVGRQVAAIPYVEVATSLRALEHLNIPASDWDALQNGELVTYAPADATFVTVDADGRVQGKVLWSAAGTVARYALIVVENQVIVVDLEHSGVERLPIPNLGHLPIARLSFQSVVPVARLSVRPFWQHRIEAERWLLFAALLIGAGRTADENAVDYVKQRRQFGQPIGTFQALQHRLADRATELDAGELLVLRAASWSEDAFELRRCAASALTISVEAAELAAKESLQFFGGYGFTLEYDIHLYLRYIKSVGVLARSEQSALDEAILSSTTLPRTSDGTD